VQPQLGLLKSTMLQLDSAFTEKAYGANSFSDFVEKLKKAGSVNVSGQGGRYIIERKTSSQPERPTPKPEEALPPFRDVLETHRMELENGVTADELAGWVHAETNIDTQQYGFQQFSEFLMFAQDRLVVRVEPDEERGLVVSPCQSRRRRRLPRKRKKRNSRLWKASRRCSNRILRRPSRRRFLDRAKPPGRVTLRSAAKPPAGPERRNRSDRAHFARGHPGAAGSLFAGRARGRFFVRLRPGSD
jgi:hypothetical protein